MSFDSLGLSAPLLKAVAKKGYTEPSPIQEKAIPPILQGRDVLASAQTGTGKTAGFILPMLQIISKKERQGKRRLRALVLTPTRELAAQIQDNARAYSEFLDVNSAVVFGGVNINPQKKTLRQGVDILIATPGRLLDLHGQNALSLKEIEFLVLDEADRMLDMGFQRDINRIFALLPKKRQNLLFSATFSKEIKNLAGKFLDRPILVEATPENTAVEVIDQKVYRVDKSDKAALTVKLIHDGEWSQVLIFTRTKHGADRLSRKLDKRKIPAAAIHGNKSQGQRTKALAAFKKGDVRVLVATDIAARGLDIPLLPYVINYELPQVPEDYVHRIGRTGRAGASGQAISLVEIDEIKQLKAIEKLIGKAIDSEVAEGFEPTDKPSEKKPQQQRSRGRNNNQSKPKKKKGNWNSKKDSWKKKRPNKD
ncbi:MAG: DEAD/DEAH box helicase [Crocinitomicaceae bacterium]